jgi:hypothetical protein
METHNKRLRTLALFLTALMLFQSCVVYHKTPTTLANASKERMNTKVTRNDGEIVKYKYITYENGAFFGVTLSSGEWIKTPLDEKELAQVYTKDTSRSTWATIAFIAIPVVATVIIVSTLPWGSDWNLFPGEEL